MWHSVVEPRGQDALPLAQYVSNILSGRKCAPKTDSDMAWKSEKENNVKHKVSVWLKNFFKRRQKGRKFADFKIITEKKNQSFNQTDKSSMSELWVMYSRILDQSAISWDYIDPGITDAEAVLNSKYHITA